MDDHWEPVPREGLIKSIEKIVGGSGFKILGKPEMKRIPAHLEGLTSFALCVKVHFQVISDGETHRTASFFVKCTPKYKIQVEFVKSAKMFHIEWLFFEKVLPLILNASAGRVILPLPTCYHNDFDGEKGSFYFEDLVESGYRSVDPSFRFRGLDYAHCSVVMRRLGRFHALTMVAEKSLSKGWTELFPEFSQDFVYYDLKSNDPMSCVRGMIDNFIGSMKEFSRGIDGLPREAESSGALEKVIRGFWSTFCGLRATPSRGWSVLSHGDLWENNIMFRYERGDDGVERPADAKFVDMQMVKCCHPAVDLVYFVYQSTGRSFREKHLGELIDEYYAALSNTLEALGSGPPPLSLDEFKSDTMGRFRTLGIIGRAFFVPTIMLRNDPAVSYGGQYRTEEGLEDFFKTGYTSRVRIRFAQDVDYREKVEEIVREFVDMALPEGLNSTHSSPLLISEVE